MTKMRRNVVAVSFFPSPKGLEFDRFGGSKSKRTKKKSEGGGIHTLLRKRKRERERERERGRKRERHKESERDTMRETYQYFTTSFLK